MPKKPPSQKNAVLKKPSKIKSFLQKPLVQSTKKTSRKNAVLKKPLVQSTKKTSRKNAVLKKPLVQIVSKLLNRSGDPHHDKYISYVIDCNKTSNADPIETYDQIDGSLDYIPGAQLLKPQVHLGQRKLFLTELQFLSKTLNPDIEYCIYAGAAPGNKTHFLATLFPNIKFILIDPNKFDIKLPNKTSHRVSKHHDIVHMYSGYDSPPLLNKSNKYKINKTLSEMKGDEINKYVNFIKKTKYKIYIIEDFMTDEYAQLFKSLNHVFISDIRSNLIDNMNPSDLDIYWNSSMMFNWITILNPYYSMLKFRPIYSNDINLSFQKSNSLNNKEFDTSKKYGIDFYKNIKEHRFFMPKSTLYLQAWAGKTSSELRMWIAQINIKNIVEYNSKEIESKLFYFNSVARGLCYHKNSNFSKDLHFCNCNDCALENKIYVDYINMNKLSNNGWNSANDLVKELDIITNKPLRLHHHNNLYNKIDIATLNKFIDNTNLEREKLFKLNKKKINRLEKKGNSGVA